MKTMYAALELCKFEIQSPIRLPFIQPKDPPGCVGYLPVFESLEDLWEFAGPNADYLQITPGGEDPE